MRTPELDKHWSGDYYCHSCKQYTASPTLNHQGHDLEFIDNRKIDKEFTDYIEKEKI